MKKLFVFSGFVWLCLVDVNAQSSVQTNLSKRSRECFDENWMFHKGDIAIKHTIRVGKYGGLTDSNVKVVTKPDAVIDYTNAEQSQVLKPADWKQINLPHDWAVEENFVNDNSLGSQPGGSGYLPTGLGFYRKEFEISEADTEK